MSAAAVKNPPMPAMSQPARAVPWEGVAAIVFGAIGANDAGAVGIAR